MNGLVVYNNNNISVCDSHFDKSAALIQSQMCKKIIDVVSIRECARCPAHSLASLLHWNWSYFTFTYLLRAVGKLCNRTMCKSLFTSPLRCCNIDRTIWRVQNVWISTFTLFMSCHCLMLSSLWTLLLDTVQCFSCRWWMVVTRQVCTNQAFGSLKIIGVCSKIGASAQENIDWENGRRDGEMKVAALKSCTQNHACDFVGCKCKQQCDLFARI